MKNKILHYFVRAEYITDFSVIRDDELSFKTTLEPDTLFTAIFDKENEAIQKAKEIQKINNKDKSQIIEFKNVILRI